MYKYKVLIIDDELVRMRPVIEEFKYEGEWQVLTADRLSDALDKLKSENHIDAIILDIIFPFDEKVKLANEDWNGLPEDIAYTGVAFYNYLMRYDLIKEIPVLVLTNAPTDQIKDRFKGSESKKLSLKSKGSVFPSEIIKKLKELIEK